MILIGFEPNKPAAALLSDDEIKDLVTSVIEETSASGLGDIGKVMPVVMQRGAGKVDGKTANILLRDLLG